MTWPPNSLKSARRDFKALRNMMSVEAFDDAIFGFHAQQAVEKTLKAWLNLIGQEHPHTHDLRLLLKRLRDGGADVSDYEQLLDLTAYSVRFRYESLPDNEEILDRGGILGEVQRLMDRVIGMLH
jgi:HEPN domain-containing protein